MNGRNFLPLLRIQWYLRYLSKFLPNIYYSHSLIWREVWFMQISKRSFFFSIEANKELNASNYFLAWQELKNWRIYQQASLLKCKRCEQWRIMLTSYPVSCDVSSRGSTRRKSALRAGPCRRAACVCAYRVRVCACVRALALVGTGPGRSFNLSDTRYNAVFIIHQASLLGTSELREQDSRLA